MNTSSRLTVLVFGLAVSIPFAGRVAQARTTGPTLGETLQLEKSTVDGAAAGGERSSDEAVAKAHQAGFCHIPRHPRDGIPASVHACPVVFADGSPQQEPLRCTGPSCKDAS